MTSCMWSVLPENEFAGDFPLVFVIPFPPRLQKSRFAKKLILWAGRGALGEGIAKIIDTPASNAHWIQCDPSLQITPDFYGTLDGRAVDGCHVPPANQRKRTGTSNLHQDMQLRSASWTVFIVWLFYPWVPWLPIRSSTNSQEYLVLDI